MGFDIAVERRPELRCLSLAQYGLTLPCLTQRRPAPTLRARHAMSDAPTDRLRAICLALPEASEKEAWGDPTFRVRDKIFAMEKRGDGRISVWCKAPPGSQEVLVGSDPEQFFIPPYVGHKGWVGMRLDNRPDWGEVAIIVDRSYRLIAPKKLSRLLDARSRRAANIA